VLQLPPAIPVEDLSARARELRLIIAGIEANIGWAYVWWRSVQEHWTVEDAIASQGRLDSLWADYRRYSAEEALIEERQEAWHRTTHGEDERP
jgi:hypothetical protein